jgi:hypothetical protein
MPIQQKYGISALTQANSTSNSTPSFNYPIPSVRVKDIILDSNHPKFETYGGWNSIGTIFYDAVDFPFAVETANTALPLYSNLKQYPLINEIVPLLFLTSWNSQTNTELTEAYYLPPINIWNSQHHNALPDSTQGSPVKSQSDYEDASNGSSRDVRRVNDNATDINLGKGFNEQINTHPLKFLTGDNILEGRWGNSFRLGSIIQNNVNYPITKIRNGQPSNVNEDSWVPIEEDINNDQSSIYLTDSQKINIEVASTQYTSYATAPIAPKEYNQSQIILNSGRLLFNSKTSDILLSSNKSINLNSINSINIDTKDFNIQGTTKIGGPNVNQSLLRGDEMVNQLNTLLDTLILFFNAYGRETPNAKIVSTPLAKTNIINSLTEVKANLELTKSKIGFIS